MSAAATDTEIKERLRRPRRRLRPPQESGWGKDDWLSWWEEKMPFPASVEAAKHLISLIAGVGDAMIYKMNGGRNKPSVQTRRRCELALVAYRVATDNVDEEIYQTAERLLRENDEAQWFVIAGDLVRHRVNNETRKFAAESIRLNDLLKAKADEGRTPVGERLYVQAMREARENRQLHRTEAA